MKISEILQGDDYQKQLRSDEWKSFSGQLKRERGNACECCRRTDVALQSHHLFYDKSLKLWDHDPADVVVLCLGCHRAIPAELKSFRRHVFRLMRPEHFRVLNGALAVGLSNHDPTEFVHAVAEMAASPGSVKRFAYAWNGGKKPE